MRNLRIATLAAVLLALAAIAAPAVAATLTVPSLAHPTIQAAVDHAAPSDTITILAGEYRENVTIPAAKTGLTIVGQLAYGGICPTTPSVIVDGGPSSNGYVFDTEAVRTTFRCLAVRNGSSGIYANADYLTVHQVSFVHNNGNGVEVYGGGYKIQYSSFTGCDSSCVYTNADDGQIRNNTFKLAGDDCIEFYGDRTLVDANTMTVCSDYGIYSDDGDGVTITNNVIDTTDDAGIELDSNDSATVALNKLSNVNSYGIYISGDLAVVRSNQIENSYYNAVYIYGTDAQIKTNVVKSGGVGDYSCFYLYVGDRSVIEGNSASICGEGGIISYFGADVVIRNNRLEKINDDNAIAIWDYIDGGPVVSRVEGNTVNGVNAGTGIFIYAPDRTGYVVAGNTATNSDSDAYRLYLSDATISSNNATQSGDGYSGGGIYVYGSRNLISSNVATSNVDYGLFVEGCENRLVSNQGRYNQDDGIKVATAGCANPTLLDRNLAQFNQGEGISLGADPATVMSNISRNNRKVKNNLSGDCTSASLGAGQTLTGNTCGDGSNFLSTDEIE